MVVGILALQGDFSKHEQMIKSIGINTLLVKDVNTLFSCDGLIIPGGESTTFMNLITRLNFAEAILEYSQSKHILATCAGSIILAKEIQDEIRFKSLNLIDVIVRRNAFGRQINSFIDNINLTNGSFESHRNFEGVFIRAPRFIMIGKDVKILATYKDEPVLIKDHLVIAGTFHPELTGDNRIHKYFIDQISGSN